MFSIEDFARLQHDVLAWNAERLVPLFARLRAERSDVEQARRRLLAWNRTVSTDSREAAIYVTWERLVRRLLIESRMPGALVSDFVARSSNMLVPALTAPSPLWFDGNVLVARDQLMLRALASAVDELDRELPSVVLAHPLAITDAARRRFNVGPFARPGYSETVMLTTARRADEAVGASFSAIFDTADWDRSIVQNAPGQSESPASPHFADLATLWAEGTYFPLVFTDVAVAANAESTLTLVPRLMQESQGTQNQE